MDPNDRPHAALQIAEIVARDQLKLQISRFRVPDGTMLQTLATVDPFVRAVMDDIVRSARVTDRTVNQETAVVSVTVQMELAPLHDLLGFDLAALPANPEKPQP